MRIIKRMPENSYLKDIIVNVALKGFQYDDDGSIVPKLRITQDEYTAIYSKMIGACGDDVGRFIDEVLQSSLTLSSQEHYTRCVADISPGSIVEMRLSTGQAIRMIYFGDLSFCVLSDDCNALHAFDMLKCLTLELRIGDKVYFRVVRNGRPFPDGNKLFCVEYLHKLSICYSNVKGAHLPKISPPINTYKTVYAKKTLRNPPRFVVDDLTLSSEDGPFKLEMDDYSFSVNLEYFETVASDNLDRLLAVCDIEKDGLGLREKRCGTFYLSNNLREMIVSEKAIIRV